MVRYGVLILGFLAAQQACADAELSSLAAAQGSNASIPDKNASYPETILLLPSNTSDPESSMFLLADVLRQSPTFNDSDPDSDDAEDENEAIVRKIMSFVAAIEGNATDTTKASPDNSTALQESNMKKRDLEDSNSPLIRRKRTFKKKKGGCMVCGMLAPIMSMIPKKGGCGMMGCGQPAYYQPPPCGHPMSPCGRPPQPPPQPVYHVPQQTCNPCQRPRPPPPPPPQPCHTCQQGYSGGYPGGMSYSSSSSSSQSASYGWAKK